jgi:hypothetical protein
MQFQDTRTNIWQVAFAKELRRCVKRPLGCLDLLSASVQRAGAKGPALPSRIAPTASPG